MDRLGFNGDFVLNDITAIERRFQMKKNTLLRSLSLGTLLVVFTLVIALPRLAVAEEKAQTVIARIGPYELTAKDFKAHVKGLPPQFQMAIASNKKFRDSFLERWVEMTLMALKARELKLDQDPELKKRFQDLKNALLAQEFSKRYIEDKVEITDEELRAYYEKHKDEYTRKEQVKARHILIKVPEGSDEKAWEHARKRLLDIKKKAEAGKDFGELAKMYSDDPGTKDRGGELGYFGKGRMVPEFEKVAFGLKPGEISDPVRTIFGWHLIQVEDKKAAQARPFDQVEHFVRQRALQEKKQQELDKLLQDVRKKYKVEINKAALDEVKIEMPRAGGGMMGPHGPHGGAHGGMPPGH